MALVFSSIVNGGFRPNPFIIGSSVSSPIVPIINLYDYDTTVVDEIIYHKPMVYPGRVMRLIMKDVLDYLIKSVVLGRFNLGIDTETSQDIVINVGKGYITDSNDNILLSFGITNKNFHDLDYQRSDYGRTVTYSPPLKDLKVNKDLCLLISNELVTNKKYALFYKKLCTSYINDAYENDIEVRFLTSDKIEKLNYSNEFALRFNTIEQLQSHLTNLVPSINFLEDSDFSNGNINPGMDISLADRNSIYTPPAVEINPISELPPGINYNNLFSVDDIENIINAIAMENGNSVSSINLIDDTPPF